jgi:uncharacterized coiled-coil protein SlyX
MPQVSISEAARLVGKNRKTIQRYIADGKLAMSQDVAGDVAGERGIDISELMRVFGSLSHATPATQSATKGQQVAPENTPNVAALEARIEGLQAVAAAKDETIATLTAQVDELREEKRELRAQVAGLLEYRRERPQEQPAARPATQPQPKKEKVDTSGLASLLVVLAFAGFVLWVIFAPHGG